MYFNEQEKCKDIKSNRASLFSFSNLTIYTLSFYLSQCYEPGAISRPTSFQEKKKKKKRKKTYLQCVTIKVEKDCKYSLIYISRYKYFI